MSEKLLILGGSGLIGSACLRHFQAQGRFLVVAPSRKELDLFQGNAVEGYFKKEKPDYVILAAGLVGGIQYNMSHPADFITQNLAIQLHVFKAAHQCEVKRLVFFASSCMYPKASSQPMREEFLLQGELEPTSSAYAVAKLSGIEMAKAYNAQYRTERFLALIPNSVYGPYDNFDPAQGHVLSVLMHRFHEAKKQNSPEIVLWGTGLARREFIYAEDVASAVDFLLDKQGVSVPLNVGYGKDVSIKELALLLADRVGYEGKIIWDASKPTGALQKLLDSQRLLALGWKPSVSLEEGLSHTYQWYTHGMR